MSTGVQTVVGKFVWHDNVSTDPEKARKFYGDLLGWGTEVFKTPEGEYPMINVGGQAHGGFGPAQGGAPSHWLGHVLVEDVDETVRRAEAAGGKIVADAFDIPEVGRMAVIADPQGAVTSAFSSAGDPPTNEGVFVWDELMTTDIEAAKSFYGEVYGWKTRDMDMGEMTYTMFMRAGEVDTAGGMNRPPGVEAPPHWLSYVATEDVDKSAAKAKELGANLFVEPRDIPTVGRFAVVQDPAGAVFGLFKGSEA